MLRHTVILKDYTHIFEEYTAADEILPGMLCELNSAGTLQKHSGAGKTVKPIMIAIEDALQGKAIDEAYATGDKVRVWLPQAGDIVYGLLADEEKVAIADFVESNGAGFFRKVVRSNDSWESADANPGGGQHSLYDLHIAGQVLEAKDLTSLEGSESSAATTTTTQFTEIRIA